MANKKITKKELTEVNGKVYNKRNVSSIDELLGIKKKTNLNASTLEEYLTLLNAMNLGDLQDHAIECGVTPKFDRDILIRTLERNFITESRQSSAARVEKTFKKVSPEVEKILREGK